MVAPVCKMGTCILPLLRMCIEVEARIPGAASKAVAMMAYMYFILIVELSSVSHSLRTHLTCSCASKSVCTGWKCKE